MGYVNEFYVITDEGYLDQRTDTKVYPTLEVAIERALNHQPRNATSVAIRGWKAREGFSQYPVAVADLRNAEVDFIYYDGEHYGYDANAVIRDYEGDDMGGDPIPQ